MAKKLTKLLSSVGKELKKNIRKEIKYFLMSSTALDKAQLSLGCKHIGLDTRKPVFRVC